MKQLALFCCLALFFPPKKENDLSRVNLKGKVKKVIHCQFPVVPGTTVVDTAWSTIYVFRFDENGNQVEDDDYTGGSLLKGFQKLNHKRIYQYDVNRVQTGVSEYKPDGTLYQTVAYRYDENGNRVERSNYYADGKLWRRSVFKYNDRGQLVTCEKFAPDSTMLEQYTYKYDEKGRQVGELLHVFRISDTTRFKRNTIDDSASTTVVRLDYVKMFVYDDSGRKVQEVKDAYGAPIPFTTLYQYMNYDSAGNWLRQVVLDNKRRPVSIIDRVIAYY